MTVYSFPNPGIEEGDMLMYYNGPILYLVTLREAGNRFLCVAGEEAPPMYPHLMVELTAEQEHRLLTSRVTFRALCLEGLPPHGLGVYHVPNGDLHVWELHPITAIDENNLPGDVPLSHLDGPGTQP